MATVSSEILFESFATLLDLSNPLYTGTDNTVYGGTDISWSAANGRGLVKMVDPQGNVFYNNTDYNNPDLTVGNGTFGSMITLPTDANNMVLTGDYQVTVTLFDNTTLPTPTEFERTYTMTVDVPTIKTTLDISWSVINPIFFKSVNTTNYNFNNYPNSQVIVHRLYNPPTIGGYQEVTTNTLNTSTFYTTTSTVFLDVTSTYTENGYYNDVPNTNVTYSLVVRQITNKEVFVDNENSVCEQYCCVKGAWEKYVSAKNKGLSSEDRLYRVWQEANGNWFMLKQALECNQSQDVAGYREQIKIVTKCNGSDCGCSDVTPEQVMGIGTLVIDPRKLTYTAASDITSYTEPQLIGFDWSNGDFLVFVDGNEVESLSGTASFNTATGEFTFGFTVFTGTEFYFQIIKY